MRLIVSPLPQVERLLAEHRPSHLVTLASPGAEAAFEAEHRLDLRFNDIAAPREGLVAPSLEHVEALIEFAQGWTGAQPLLIHCWAGVSRSTAAAYVIACARTAPGREGDWAARLRDAAPTATPNPLIVAHADRLLDRGGAMVRAVHAIGRGAETDWGAPFELDLTAEGDGRR
ncbi:protein tyrosine phosphatase [Brevundimonas diminuta]|uniref:tyrosine phosphatase family protein n=1 Tax=Brevundimonas diminuta TaxID=293 RepID=UPI0022AFC907|nr:protein tyrosine phosphatase [Brevundimonas diminuta]MCZ4108200.1 protein tyrosine phosphatase [Brevundimonas diminuta]